MASEAWLLEGEARFVQAHRNTTGAGAPAGAICSILFGAFSLSLNTCGVSEH